MCLLLFFFFSSRRRHTRLQGDWSSDVCSSDLSVRHAKEEERLKAKEQVRRARFPGLIQPRIGMTLHATIPPNNRTSLSRFGHFNPLVVRRIAHTNIISNLVLVNNSAS